MMKVVVKFHRNCVCSFGEKSKYLFLWGFNVVAEAVEALVRANTQNVQQG